MIHELPPLPFDKEALSPFISAETLEFHHDHHHAAYVEKLNHLIAGTPCSELTLEEIVLKASKGAIFNNAAQAWNHYFYWKSLCPPKRSNTHPNGELARCIARDFGSHDEFMNQFAATANDHFGSGWVWVVLDHRGKLHIQATHDAGNPMREGLNPLLVCDVWEHAYYIDYRNERPKYIEAFEHVLNWEFAETRFNQTLGVLTSAA